MGVDKDKILQWLANRLELLDGADEWDSNEFLAGEYSAFRTIEDLIEENFFEPISGVEHG